MTDYTQLIEQLKAPDNTLCNAGAKAIEALQARVVELDNDTADLAMLADQYKAERDALQARVAELKSGWQQSVQSYVEAIGQRDTALAKLAALESDQDHNAGEVVGFTDEYVLVEFPCEGNTVNIEAGMLLYPHPVIAAGAQAQQPLSEEQIELIWEARRPAWSEAVARFHFARAIEAAHKIGGSV